MQCIINGKWVDASDKSTIDVVNPYTGKVIDKVPNCTPKDVNKAVECAKKAQASWAKMPVYQKAEILYKFMPIRDVEQVFQIFMAREKLSARKTTTINYMDKGTYLAIKHYLYGIDHDFSAKYLII